MNKLFIAALALVVSATAFADIDHSQLINLPGGGTGAIAGGDVSQVETGETILGFGFQSGTNTMADDFTVGSKFHVTGISVFGYATNATAPAVTSVSWAIDANPTTSLTLTSVTSQWWNPNGVGVYRCGTGVTNSSARRLNVGEVTGLDITLDPGTYFLSVQAAGINFTPPLPSSQAVYGMNALQDAAGAGFAPVANGSGGADLAFIIHGEAVPEPATMTVLGLGALALMRRRFKK